MATIIKMPALSDTMSEGVLVAWHKKVGDKVKSGDLLADIETDKAVMEFESFYNGTLLYTVEAGQTIRVDVVIAVIGEPGEDFQSQLSGSGSSKPDTAKVEEAKVETPVAPKAEEPKAETPTPEVLNTILAPLGGAGAESTLEAHDDRVKASPLAKSMAKQEGISLANVKGSGDDGRIVKRDVEAFLQTKEETPRPSAQAAAPAVEGTFTDFPLSQMRKTIARRLGESLFTAPHFYLTMEICMDRCMETRTKLNELSPVKLSFNDFVVKATSMALRQHPAVNSSWLGDKIRQYHYVNMGVAVAVEDGLLVPVVHDTDQKSLSQIASAVRELADKAKERKLQLAEMQGNTFTISNLGMFGIEEFTAIINPPDACILAVGGISERAVRGKDGGVDFSNFMKVTLSCDHRVVDGATGSKFLQTLKAMLEEPMRMMI